MRKRTKIILAALLVVVAGIIALIWWFLRDDAPDPVAIGDAVADASATVAPDTSGASTAAVTDPVVVTTEGAVTTVASSAYATTAATATASTDAATTAAATTAAAASTGAATTTATSTADATSATAAGDVSGNWAIDPEFGEFDFESATGSFVGFRIEEELQGIGSTTAVGRTGDVTGSITIDGTTLTAAEFTVDLTTITTNESRRDDRVQGALETGEFPEATFTLTAPVELGEAAQNGDPVAVTVSGDLTIHGVTQPIEMDIAAQYVDSTNRIALVGSTAIVFADYGVEVPSAPVVVSAEDNGILELQFILQPEA